MNVRQIARDNDGRILKLANYVESKGTIRHTTMSQVFSRFSELKCLLKRGEFKSIDEMEESIYSRYGIIEEAANRKYDIDSMSVPDMIKKIRKSNNGYEAGKKS